MLSYAYLFASYLVAGTGMALGMSSIPDMTREARTQARATVAAMVPRGFRYALLIVAPALAALIACGAPLIHDVLPNSLSAAQVGTLRTFTALLIPWTLAALLVNFLLPLLLALGRSRLLGALALPLVLVHVAATALGSALFGVDGAVGAFWVAPALLAATLLVAGAGRQLAGQLAGELATDTVRFVGLAALAFATGWVAGEALPAGTRPGPPRGPGRRRPLRRRPAASWPGHSSRCCSAPSSSAPRRRERARARTGAARARRRRAERRPSAPARASVLRGDRRAIVLLAACFAAMAAVTWRRWGVPELDAGAELTTADLVKHGALVYRDVRYYYGPLGLYSLALAFKVFGTSYTTAFAFGLLQAAAILAAFYALARQWLAPLAAALSTAVLLAIGFSGTAFNFVLPHTNSATFGVLCLLLLLLALARERLVPAGLAVGLVALTRPEFLAVAGGRRGGVPDRPLALRRPRGDARVGVARGAASGRDPGAVLGWFASRVGVHTLIAENLWPVKFISGGAKTESDWIPLTPASAAGLLARAAIYLGLLAALVATVEGWRRRSGARRALALWPLAAALAALAITDGLLRTAGLLAGQRTAIEHEARHLMITMSWLPGAGARSPRRSPRGSCCGGARPRSGAAGRPTSP